MLNKIQHDYLNSVDFYNGLHCYDLELPWIAPKAIHFLLKNIKNTDNILEYGSGGSTIFFSKRCNIITTYEADYKWLNKIENKLKNTNVKYNFVENQSILNNKINELTNAYYDILLVDIGTSLKNRNREELFFNSISKMKKNAIYILDNRLSKLHYFNIYKWELKDFQNILGKHYELIDFDDRDINKYASTTILFPKFRL
jgi:hypothetical protein